MNVNPVNVNEVQNSNLTVMMIRLLNGDEIVGKTGLAGNLIKVVKPAAVLLQPGASGKANMALIEAALLAVSVQVFSPGGIIMASSV